MSGGHGESAFVPRRFVLGEFQTPETMLAAARQMRERGYKGLDTHTPYPVHGIEEALGLGRPKIPTLVLGGAISGVVLAFSMIYYMNVYDWPINVANRPPFALPLWIPIMFELAVLLAGFSAFFGLWALIKLPKPYHPVFESDAFSRASIDRFFVSVEVPATASAVETADALRAAGGGDVHVVEESER